MMNENAKFFHHKVLTGVLTDSAFAALGLVPGPNPDIREAMTYFTFNYTFWLNLVFGTAAAYLFVLSAKVPCKPTTCRIKS